MIPLRAFRTPTGRGSNRPSLCATPPCATKFSAGRRSYHPTGCRVFLHTSALRGSGACYSSRGRLHTTDDGTVFLVRTPTPLLVPDPQRPAGRAPCFLNDESIRIYAQACHPMDSCHLGTARTLRMLECFFWWIGMIICTPWRLRSCLKCQALLNLGPVDLHLDAPAKGPDIALSVDYLTLTRSHLKVTPASRSFQPPSRHVRSSRSHRYSMCLVYQAEMCTRYDTLSEGKLHIHNCKIQK